MRVTEIWRFPVKSMGGERLDAARVTEFGIEGDRGWGIHDVSTGTMLTARRSPDLLFATARIADGALAIMLPDGSTVGVEGADAALSSWLGREVELHSAAGTEVGGTYEVPLDVENDADWVSWQGPGGAFHDSTKTRVSLVSTSTLQDWDRRRFRTNVIVDGSGEDEFVGGSLAVGTTVLDVRKHVDRCVMVTRPQPDLDRDLGVLKTINAERASNLGIGCLVTTPGTISLGDEVGHVAP